MEMGRHGNEARIACWKRVWLVVSITTAMPSVVGAVPGGGAGFEVKRYVQFPSDSRQHMGFDSAGNLLLQRGTAIYRVRPDASDPEVVAELLTGPDAFLLDRDGRFTGVPRALVVIMSRFSRDYPAAVSVLPTGGVVPLWDGFEPTGTNGPGVLPADIAYDRDDRLLLLYASYAEPSVRLYVSDGGLPRLLLSKKLRDGGGAVAVDPANRIFLSTDSIIQILAPDGSVVEDDFAEFDTLSESPWIRFGPGGAFGTNSLYVAERTTLDSAGIIQVDPDGRRTPVADGFVTDTGGLTFEFGPDGMLYVLEGGRGGGAVFRVSPVTPDFLKGKRLTLRAPSRAGPWSIDMEASVPKTGLGKGAGSVDDPTEHGGTLRVASKAGGFDDTYALPAGRWRRLGKRRVIGYKFKGTNPSVRLSIVAGRTLQVRARGGELGHVLPPVPVDVGFALVLGGQPLCVGFAVGEVRLVKTSKLVAGPSAQTTTCPGASDTTNAVDASFH
jgi:hypothetical protein